MLLIFLKMGKNIHGDEGILGETALWKQTIQVSITVITFSSLVIIG